MIGALKFSEDLKKINDEQTIIKYYLDTVRNLIASDTASFLKPDFKKKTITITSVSGRFEGELDGMSFPFGGIAGWCFENNKDILVKDTKGHPLFMNKVDKVTDYVTRSLICVIMRLDEQIYGSAEFINPLSKDAFDERDLEIVRFFNNIVEMKIKIIKLISKEV